MKYGAKVDGNQRQLVRELRRLPGVSVFPAHAVGGGFPDLVVGYQGRNYLLEIKDPAQPPSGRKLTGPEQRFRDGWRGQYAVVLCLDDVLAAFQGGSNA